MTILPNPIYDDKLNQSRIFADQAVGEKGIRAGDSRWSWFGRSIKYTGVDGKKHYMNRTSAITFLQKHHIDTQKLSNKAIKAEIKKITEKNTLKPEIHALFSKAQSYGYDDQIEIVKKFVADIIDNPDASFSIKRVEPGLTTGITGAPVYLVSDTETNQLLMVVKLSPSLVAAKEATALNFLNSLEIKDAQFSNVLGVGKIENSHLIMIAQSAVAGKPLEHFMTSVGSLEGQERVQKFENLSQIIGSSARALSSLHNHKPKSYENETATAERNTILEQTQTEFSSYIKRINEAKKENPVLKTINTDHLMERAQNVKFSPVGEYVHHDYHLGNVFYDEESSKISVIDNDGVLESVDSKSKEPIGVGAEDVVYFMQWIAIQGQISKLTPEEIQSLQNAFLNAYLESREGVDENLTSELEFMKIFIPAKYICDLQDALKIPGHPWKKALGEENLKGFIQFLANDLSNA